MSKPKILITGIAGLVGSRLAEYLCKTNKYDVYGIDDFSGGLEDNLNKLYKFNNFTFRKIDCNDIKNLQEVFEFNKFDYVYLLHAWAAEGCSLFVPQYNYQQNFNSAVNVITNCINFNVKKVIFTSSMAIYGDSDTPFYETTAPNPKDFYALAKIGIEDHLKICKDVFDLNYSIVRAHNIIGRGQNIFDKYRNVIGIWIRQVLNNEPITIFGDGLQKRAFSDIQFCLEPFEKLMSSDFDGRIFNLGADKFYTILDAAQILKKVANKFGYNVEIKHLEERKEVKEAYCNHNLAKNLLNFVDNTDLEKTIYEMFTWAKNLKNQNVKKIDYEITKELPKSWL